MPWTRWIWRLASCSVGLTPAMLASCSDKSPPPFELQRVEPSIVRNSVATPAVLEGTGFYNLVKVHLNGNELPTIDRRWDVRVDTTLLQSDQMSRINTTSLAIVIPAGLPVGIHDLSVTDPRGQSRTLLHVLTVVADGDTTIPNATGGATSIGLGETASRSGGGNGSTVLSSGGTQAAGGIANSFTGRTAAVGGAGGGSAVLSSGRTQATGGIANSSTGGAAAIGGVTGAGGGDSSSSSNGGAATGGNASSGGSTSRSTTSAGASAGGDASGGTSSGGSDSGGAATSRTATGGAPIGGASVLGGATGAFGAPVLIATVSDPAGSDFNPSFTGDQLELYFNSIRPGGPGNSDIWVSKRASAANPWGTPVLVAELSTVSKDSTPKVSSDGLILWFSSDRTGCVGSLDVWVSKRATRADAWGTPTCITELNSPLVDSTAAADASMLTLVLTSARTGSQGSDLYWTTRASVTNTWANPVLIPGVNTTGDDADGQLIWGGLQLCFVTSGRSSTSDIYCATRSSLSQSFGSITALSSINSSTAAETGPWLSEDGHYIIFSSNRGGHRNLYEATR